MNLIRIHYLRSSSRSLYLDDRVALVAVGFNTSFHQIKLQEFDDPIFEEEFYMD